MTVNLISDQVEVVIDILKRTEENNKISKEHWNKLFHTQGFQLLEKRESEMNEGIKKSEFKGYIIDKIASDGYLPYEKSLDKLNKLDLDEIIESTKDYLPDNTNLDTDIIPVIKPQKNSFIHKINDKLVLFLYLEPDIIKEKMENKLIHELHHIGFDYVYQNSDYSYLLKPAQKVIEWTNAFGEGFAMLAAAQGLENHPNKFDEDLKSKWDKNMENYNKDFHKIQNFLLTILEGHFADERKLYNRGFQLMTNNGGQGSWYTVGYKIAVVIEKTASRDLLIKCMQDLTQLYCHYNRLVKQYNKKQNKNLHKWDQKIINVLKVIKRKNNLGGSKIEDQTKRS